MPHATGLVILHSLDQFVSRVHDKGPIPGNRLANRLAAHDQHGRVLFGFEQHSLAAWSEQDHFDFLHWLHPIRQDFSVQDKRCCIEPFRQRQFNLMSGRQPKATPRSSSGTSWPRQRRTAE